MKIIMTLSITKIRPEEMRVIEKNDLFLVQTKTLSDKWITQAEHKNEKTAVLDCCNWY